MMNVEQVLLHKGRQVFTVTGGDTVRSALRMLVANNIGAVVVCDGPRVVGILSERDCVRRVMSDERSLDATLDRCMALITDQRVRHLPVIEHGELLGLVSVGDLVKAKLAEQADAIADLERYITTPYSVSSLGH